MCHVWNRESLNLNSEKVSVWVRLYNGHPYHHIWDLVTFLKLFNWPSYDLSVFSFYLKYTRLLIKTCFENYLSTNFTLSCLTELCVCRWALLKFACCYNDTTFLNNSSRGVKSGTWEGFSCQQKLLCSSKLPVMSPITDQNDIVFTKPLLFFFLIQCFHLYPITD